jgi:ferric-dicitrate binding protein FerR (iron transport regulator)
MSNDSTRIPEAADDELTQLFDHASPRPRPGDAAQASAFEALHGEWRQVTKRRRRHNVARFCIAATLLAAVALGVFFNREGAQTNTPVAEIARMDGADVTWRDENSRGQTIDAATRSFFVGQRLSTGAESRVALAWHGGGSLRVDENTRIEFVSARSIRLLAGQLYFDSLATHSEPTGDSTRTGLSIQTPAGEVLHVGTQFMMRVAGEEVVLSVREGQVKVAGDGFELVVSSGEQLDIDVDGPQARRSIEGYGELWSWAEDIAPQQSLDGRTALELLDWVARETGRRLVYASPSGETLARETIIRGLDDRSPGDALQIMPYFTDFTYEIRDDTIVISSR